MGLRLGLKQGDLITVIVSRDYNKQRPAVVIQVSRSEGLESVTFLPLSSTILPEQIYRVTILPSPENGLRKPSQVMADKCSTLPTHKIGARFGRLSEPDMTAINRALAIFLGFV
jgi:mRNA interferase MazF